jgi:hypothetical protein
LSAKVSKFQKKFKKIQNLANFLQMPDKRLTIPNLTRGE